MNNCFGGCSWIVILIIIIVLIGGCGNSWGCGNNGGNCGCGC